jgi:hypothetical protein
MDHLVHAIEDAEDEEISTCLLSAERDIHCSLMSNVSFSNTKGPMKTLKGLTDEIVQQYEKLRGKHSLVNAASRGRYYRAVYQYE